MSTTITDGNVTVELTDDLEWSNEYDWTPVSQDVQRMIGGGLVIQEAALIKGRPIHLNSGGDVWDTKAKIDAVYQLASVPDKVLNLTLSDARTFKVVFDRSQGSPVLAVPVFRQTVRTEQMYMTNISIKFIEVE